MNIAFVGCGYVADYYFRNLPNYPDLHLVGVWDSNAETLDRFARHWSVRAHRSLDELLADPALDIVVNLTNPDSHYDVSAAALAAGKHVYTEKPLAMRLEHASALVESARRDGLQISSAPCTLLSETAQTIWRALRKNAVGKVRLVYAQIEDGNIVADNFQNWRSESGNPWPWRDEFEIGCVVEHAGYYLTWLVAFFGPVKTVDAFSTTLLPEKGADGSTPDYVVAGLSFASGVKARLTCGIAGPVDRSMTVFGDAGELSVDDCWDYGAPVFIRKPANRRRRKKIRLVRKAKIKHPCHGPHDLDFARGIADLANSIATGGDRHLPADFSLHVNEIALALRKPSATAYPYEMTTSCAPVTPPHWARR